MTLRDRFEKETGEPAMYNPRRVVGEAIRVNNKYLEWLEIKLQNTSYKSYSCRGCVYDGMQDNPNSPCEYCSRACHDNYTNIKI